MGDECIPLLQSAHLYIKRSKSVHAACTAADTACTATPAAGVVPWLDAAGPAQPELLGFLLHDHRGDGQRRCVPVHPRRQSCVQGVEACGHHLQLCASELFVYNFGHWREQLELYVQLRRLY